MEDDGHAKPLLSPTSFHSQRDSGVQADRPLPESPELSPSRHRFGSEYPSAEKKRKRTVCCRLCAGFFLCLGLALGLFWGLEQYKYGKPRIQHMLNAATMTFEDMAMVHRGGDTSNLIMQATVNMQHPTAMAYRGIQATILPATVDVYYIGPVVPGCVSPSPPGATSPLAPPSVCYIGSVFSDVNVDVDSTKQNNQFVLEGLFTVTNTSNFDAFGSSMISDPVVQWYMAAEMRVHIKLWGVTVFRFSGLRFAKTSSVTGFDGIKNVTLGVFDAVIGNGGDVDVHMTVHVHNPSIVSINPMGNVTMNVLYEGSSMGVVHTDNSVLVPGPNKLVMRGLLEPTSQLKLDQLFSHFLSGMPQPVAAVGSDHGSSTIPLYSPVFKSMHLRATLHPMQFPLAITGMLNETAANLIDGLQKYGRVTSPVRLMLHNPFSAPVVFRGLNLTAMFDGVEVAYINSVLDSPSNPPVELPGNTTMYSPWLIADLDTKGLQNVYEVIEAVLTAIMVGHVSLSLGGSLHATVGNVHIHSNYSQISMPTCLQENITGCVRFVAEHPTWYVPPSIWD